jgi:hypothetical protein
MLCFFLASHDCIKRSYSDTTSGNHCHYTIIDSYRFRKGIKHYHSTAKLRPEFSIHLSNHSGGSWSFKKTAVLLPPHTCLPMPALHTASHHSPVQQQASAACIFTHQLTTGHCWLAMFPCALLLQSPTGTEGRCALSRNQTRACL